MGSDLSSVEDLYKHKKRIRLDPGKWKYVVIKVSQNGQPVYFIRSKSHQTTQKKPPLYFIEFFSHFFSLLAVSLHFLGKKWANFHEEIIGKFSSKISNKTVNGKKVKDSTMIECLGGGKIYFNRKNSSKFEPTIPGIFSHQPADSEQISPQIWSESPSQVHRDHLFQIILNFFAFSIF